MLFPFDEINSEEKSAYFYLFSLLSQGMEHRIESSPVGDFIQSAGITVRNEDPFAIWPEVSVFKNRYIYFKSKSNDDAYAYMVILVSEIARELGLARGGYTGFRDLTNVSAELTDLNLTHPKQIKEKLARMQGDNLREEDKKLYSMVHSLFNTKTEMLIRMGRSLFVIDLKLNSGFVKSRQDRLRTIQNLYCSDLIRSEFGFNFFPQGGFLRVGLKEHNPDIDFKTCVSIAERYLGLESRITQSLSAMLEQAMRQSTIQNIELRENTKDNDDDKPGSTSKLENSIIM